MTSKLTREEMQELISALRLTPTSTVNGISLGRLADALSEYEAAMDSEPVAFISGAWTLVYYRPPKESGLRIGDKLYRHAQQPVVPDEMLCDFYEVNNWPDLVRELVKHVEQLQDSAKRNVKPWEDTFPETLLPAYIERVKLADEACRAELDGNSPVIPDGYMMVPKLVTPAMVVAGGDVFVKSEQVSEYPTDAARNIYKAMLAAAPQPQNTPQNIPEIIPNGLIAAVNRLLDNDGSRGCYSAIRCFNAREEVERLLAAAPQEVQ